MLLIIVAVALGVADLCLIGCIIILEKEIKDISVDVNLQSIRNRKMLNYVLREKHTETDNQNYE